MAQTAAIAGIEPTATAIVARMATAHPWPKHADQGRAIDRDTTHRQRAC